MNYDDPFRRTGRTIRMMMRVITLMSTNPGVWIKVEDHWPTPQAQRHAVDWVKRTCSYLEMRTESKANDQGYFVRFIRD